MSKTLVCKSVANVSGNEGKTTVTILMYSDGSKEVVTDGDVDPMLLDMLMKSSPSVKQGGSQCALGCGKDKSVQLEAKKESLPDDEANRVREVFHTFDSDKGGSLNCAELKSMCTELIGNEISAAAAMTVLEAMDKNKDKQISLEELLSFWPGIQAFLTNALKSGEFKESSTPTTKPVTRTDEEEVPSDGTTPQSDTSPVPGEGGSILTDVEKDVFHEINVARTQPQIYAAAIEKQATYIKDGVLYEPGGGIPIRLNEGIGAWREAAAELLKQKPLPPLKEAPLGLYLASKDHCRDQAASGSTGHTGKDGSSPSGRCTRYGKWISSCGENISYGCNTGRGIVMQLIIDDGVPSRGHRKNIYNTWSVAGVAVGTHPVFGHMCTQNFAGGYTEGSRNDVKLKKALDKALKENSMSKNALKSKPAEEQQKAQKASGESEQQGKIKVYGRETCGLCTQMYDALNQASVPFLKADIDKDKSFFSAMQASGFKGGRFGLPVIVTSPQKAIWEIGDAHALAAELASSLDANNSGKGGNVGREKSDDIVVKVFGMEGCGRCTAMYRLLDNASVGYEKLDMEVDESYFQAMIASGFQGGSFMMPVVVVGDKAHWDIEDQRALANELAGPSASSAPLEHLEASLKTAFPACLSATIMDIFKRHDVNQDGQLSKDETHTFLDELYRTMGLEARCDEIQRKEIVELFRNHDVDRNQKLSVKEIANYLCNSHFAMSASKKSSKS
eukprot:TRINITY_DN14833_c0_g1_i1.p1 TRINITY_DN14833_c0_g1~~TRINITY_DN14833_c0_g1_i1.p1  ORF type:complete len:747 (+),score=163.99 TRINITY_DN14833_c0_g1_i1:51-2243(+)